jgi:GNAT superfamily N-acetyltransferase
MFLAEDEDGPFGMLILVAVPNPLSGEVFAEELCWWVEPHRRGALKAGPALLQHAEAWTRAKGITTLKMVAPANTEVGLFYARQGYHAVETAWAKTI